MDDLVRQWELQDSRDAWEHTGEAPPVESPDAYGQMRPEHAAPVSVKLPAVLPLTVAEWRARKMADPDFLFGNWLTTTSRVLVTAATGLGKTNFAIALGQAVSAGADLLHWQGRRPANVLYIDGEMSARLLRTRLIDEAARQGDDPKFFFALSHEDIPNFRPLNTIPGQEAIERLIEEIGSVDLVIFDNVMCLIAGDQKDTLPWQQTLPWALSLTRRGIGQLWVHHTGHDETRGYGDKAREWQMDTVIHLETAKREDTDVSFTLQFRKARERTPTTRFDFQDVKIALVNDRWEHELTDARRPGKLAPRAQKALEALLNVLAGDKVTMLPGNRRAAHRDLWAAECNARGLIDQKGKANSARTLMNTFRRELVEANRIACEDDLQWVLRCRTTSPAPTGLGTGGAVNMVFGSNHHSGTIQLVLGTSPPSSGSVTIAPKSIVTGDYGGAGACTVTPNNSSATWSSPFIQSYYDSSGLHVSWSATMSSAMIYTCS